MRRPAFYITFTLLLLISFIGFLKYTDYSPELNLSTTGTKKYTKTEFHSPDYTKVEYTNQLSPYDKQGNETVIVLSTIGNGNSYGRDKTMGDFFDTILTLNHNRNDISIGFLIGDEGEFEHGVQFFSNYFNRLSTGNMKNYIHKVTLVNSPMLEGSFSAINRGNRHDDNLQRLRRRTIAKSRNFIINNALDIERFVFFIDSDIIRIHQNDMLTTFINSGKDIVVPRIVHGDNIDYDKNTWVGQRTIPNEEQFKKMDENDWDHWNYVPMDVIDNMTHLENIIWNNEKLPDDAPSKQLDYMMEVDSVGGAILFSKSIIYKQGIQFPPNYVIGTTWDRLEGYDGIETEGLCYTAKTSGYKCWAMPNMVAEHIWD